MPQPLATTLYNRALVSIPLRKSLITTLATYTSSIDLLQASRGHYTIVLPIAVQLQVTGRITPYQQSLITKLTYNYPN